VLEPDGWGAGGFGPMMTLPSVAHPTRKIAAMQTIKILSPIIVPPFFKHE
jgi:hypothetical protein